MRETRLLGGSTNNRIELNLFTNSTNSAPSVELIQDTYDSFVTCFGPINNVTVWYNPYPNTKDSAEYKQNLEDSFDRVIETTSLSDGYIRSIERSESEFMFMLEHDWNFLQIDHSLDEICEQMNELKLAHLRFNKRPNRAVGADSVNFKQVNGSLFPVCLTPFPSNNPHIIHRERYLESAFKMLRRMSGSKGVEERLNNKGIKAAIYGPIEQPNKVIHTNGRDALYNQCPVCGTEKPVESKFCSPKCRSKSFTMTS